MRIADPRLGSRWNAEKLGDARSQLVGWARDNSTLDRSIATQVNR